MKNEKLFDFSKLNRDNIAGLAVFIVVSTIILLLLRSSNFYIYHSAVEIFSAMISIGIFTVAINTYRFSSNDFLMFLGIGYLFVGLLDLIHALSYSEMHILTYSTYDTPTRIWFVARSFELTTIFIATILINRKIGKINNCLIFCVYTAVFCFVLYSLMYLNLLPAFKIEGQGLTNFKIMTDYIISLGFMVCAYNLLRKRKSIDMNVFFYIEVSIILKVISEICVANFTDNTDLIFLIGHILKVISFYFIYKSIIVNCLQRPFNMLVYNLDKADSTIMEKEKQRQYMEDAIARNEKCYDLIIDNSGDGIIIAVDGRLIYANSTATKVFDAEDTDQLIGMQMIDLVHEDFAAKSKERMEELMEKNTILPFIEVKLKSLKGKTIFGEGCINKIIYRGKPAIFTIFKNFAAHEKIISLKNDLIEKDKQLTESYEYNKDIIELFSNISHELKTPLNILLGSIQLLSMKQEEKLPDDYEMRLNKYLGIMKQNTFRLIRIVNNIIDTTKYDSGCLKLNMHNQDIVNIVEDITISASDYIKYRGINIVFDTDAEEKIMAVDADKIERIMLNLLSNAVKFTEKGDDIFVNLYDKGDFVEISVKDTGIGIPEEKLGIIFDRFMQVDKTFTRNREGSGVGLSLVKTLTELHGGTVRVNSRIGEGSEFIIDIPAELIDEEESDSALTFDSKVDKINIEFSDIYSVN